MSEDFDEEALLVDEAIKRLIPSRRTFTEEEALSSVWEAGYEFIIQSDERFILAQEGNAKQPMHLSPRQKICSRKKGEGKRRKISKK